MRRTLMALGLTASLVTAGPSGLLDRFWAFLDALWSGSPAVHQPHSKEGCGMDPSGRCSTDAQPQSDAGCGMDPSGRCNPGS